MDIPFGKPLVARIIVETEVAGVDHGIGLRSGGQVDDDAGVSAGSRRTQEVEIVAGHRQRKKHLQWNWDAPRKQLVAASTFYVPPRVTILLIVLESHEAFGETRSYPMTAYRLSVRTRDMASQALDGHWGRQLAELRVTLPPQDQTYDLSDENRYARGIRLIAEHAPVRILPGQKVIGAATLLQAANHKVPVRTPDGNIPYGSVSHTTLGFDMALQIGYSGLRQRIDARFARGGLDARGVDFLAAMRQCIDAAGVWHARHLDLLDELIANSAGAERQEYQLVRRSLENVPENPPADFRQAVQSLWFLFSFQRLCGNWPGIGRIDQMLGGYLGKDLDAGRITLDEARELLAHFWINGCDWVGAPGSPTGGDGQHYQNIILAGIDADGNEVANEVTYLVLDIVEELRISDFPIAVRLSSRTPDKLVRRVAEVQRLGGGTVAIYNEDQIITSLVAFGYPLPEARNFTNDGCWEVLIPGFTNFSYCPFDTLALLQKVLGVTEDDEAGTRAGREFASFEDIYTAFIGRLRQEVGRISAGSDKYAVNGRPATLVSLLVNDCIERARGYNDRGARYTVRSPHAGGLQDVANCLLVIGDLVYQGKSLSLGELVEILRANWAGHEPLRQSIRSRFNFYGNDSAEADGLVRRLLHDFIDAVAAARRDNGVLQPPGVSSFGREIEWMPLRKATSAGTREGDFLATNFSPAPGSDRLGPTAVIKSHCSLGLSRLTCGTALELKMHPSSLTGENGLAALAGLLRSFVRLGGIFMQVDVVDSRVLRDAQAHPEKYQHLAVRISGWSARFATLSRQWQDMIINRTEQR